MSCKATRPLISRDDSFLVKPDLTELQQATFLNNVSAYGATASVESILNTVGEGVTFDLMSNIATETSRVAGFADLSGLPGLKQKIVDGSGYINPFEILDLVATVGYDPFELLNELLEQQTAPVSNDTFLYLQQLDFYYNQYLSAVNETSKCDSLYRIWQLIVQIELLVKTAQNWIARLKNFTLKELIGKLQLIEKAIREFIEEIADRILKRIQALVAKMLAKLSGCVENIERISAWLNEKVTNLKNFFTGKNLEQIIKDIGDEFKKLVTPLDEFSPSNIAYMVWRLCSFIESIKNLFTNPLALFQNALAFMCQSQVLLEARDAAAANAAVLAGGQRLTREARRDLKIQIADGFAAQTPLAGLTNSPTGRSGGTGGTGNSGALPIIQYPTDGSIPENTASWRHVRPYPYLDPTAEEIAWAASITKSGTEYFTFNQANVINMASRARARWEQESRGDPNRSKTWRGMNLDELRQNSQGWNNDDAGWDMINPNVWIRLRRVAQAMRSNFGRNYRFSINSAYRNTFYNHVMAKGARNSVHMSAGALDFSTEGMSNAEKVALVYHCASNRLPGMGCYSTFMHADYRATPMTWEGTGINVRPTPSMRSSGVTQSFYSWKASAGNYVSIPVGGDFDKIKPVSFSDPRNF